MCNAESVTPDQHYTTRGRAAGAIEDILHDIGDVALFGASWECLSSEAQAATIDRWVAIVEAWMP